MLLNKLFPRPSFLRTSTLLSGALTVALFAGCTGADGDETPGPDSDGVTGVACEDDVCVLSGDILDDLTLTRDKVWLLRGGVFIGDDENETILTIESGTTVYGETSTLGMLAIRRGSKIMAEGTEDAPIVFTSSKLEGERARGDWGGIILNGRAPINGCGEDVCESFGEGGTGFFGGDNPDDSSGVLKYVRVEFAGSLISPDNELNGVAFQGVGRGTEVDYLQVHMAKDDGIEFFGGTANVKHVLITGAADDNVDWTDGWQGNAQFIVVQQYEDAGDNGIEADNNAEDNTARPMSNPTLSNITLIGSPGSDQSDVGILIREGSGAEIANAIVTGWGDACLDIDHDATFANIGTGDLTVHHSIFSCDTLYATSADDSVDLATFIEDDNEGNETSSDAVEEPYDSEGPDFRPAGAGMSDGDVPAASFFEDVSFRGGVDPLNDWTRNWTVNFRR